MVHRAIDQLGRTITVSDYPRRIISLVPSQTELLFDLGLSERLIGISRYCCHPQIKPGHIKLVGGTKAIEFERVAALSPDLIIANKEENTLSDIEALQQCYPVWVSDVNKLADAIGMIRLLGNLLNVMPRAQRLCDGIMQAFADVRPLQPAVNVAYLIWRKPYMVAAGDTFIDDMLRQCGYENVFSTHKRYPQVSLQQIKLATPQFIFLSSEPYPFAGKHIKCFEAVLPRDRIILVNGEYFSWYGSRLLQAPDYFEQLKTELSLSHD